MAISLIEILRQGGCYWKRERHDSPGHSIAIPNGTPFKIAIEGPTSHRFVHGTCLDGYFVLRTGAHKEEKFASANAAVNTVREPSTNAFLYIQFQTDDGWLGASTIRKMDMWRCDDGEELSIEMAIERIRPILKKSGKTLDEVQLKRKAAEVVEKNPKLLIEARRRVEYLSSI